MSTPASSSQLTPTSSTPVAAPVAAPGRVPPQYQPPPRKTLFERFKHWATSGPYRERKRYTQDFPGSDGPEEDVRQDFPGAAGNS
ncbi:hypothetical protein DACRYDRAFT_22930 [Dacryopinax primogenitus]|uniref:Uncharacterized protein n=1 Tax=Dacryopinax primogenitus (strain DJM 731) TaxID=1858805 RepID=M5FZ69_DACPD|nr:uncharacterized protein DACRYDRAFT_22930 [Dacryopinax primogenitus]EJU01170.1 hypothetical protein DACRYDRAFT_22930 [Dacryopinax primogenitus]